MHFAEARANVVTNDAGDAETQTAEYKVCAAEVRPVAEGDDASEGGAAAKPLYPGTFYGIDAPA